MSKRQPKTERKGAAARRGGAGGTAAAGSPPGGGPTRAGALGKRLAAVALGLLAPLALLALLEGVLTLAGAGEGLLYDDPFVGFAPGSDLFAPRTLPTGERVYVTRDEKLRFFNRQSFPAVKAPGTYRIFTLGGSTTYGRPYDDRVSFSNQLRLYLEAADPSRRWEVINAGGISYASYRVALLMRELARYQPDLFILYTGHNEFLEERSYAAIIHQSPALKRLRMWLSGFRFAALARQGWRSVAGGGGPPAGAVTLESEVTTRLDGWTGLEAYHRDDELRRSVVEHFAYNLDRMAALAEGAGAGLVLVAPVSNLKDFSPFKSEHRAGLPAADAERFAALVAAGRARLEAGEPAAALEPLRAAVAIDPEHADGRFRLGRALLAAGEREAALGELVAAKDLDVAPLRALDSLVAAVRRAAAEHDLPLVDLPRLLGDDCQRRFGHRALGDEYLQDHVHPDIATHGRIAGELVATLAAEGVARPAAGWSEARRRRVLDELLASIDRHYYAERDLNLAKVLGWAGKLEEAEAPLVRAAQVLDDSAELHLNLGILYQKTGRPALAVDELRRAAELDPGVSESWFNLGVAHGRRGELGPGIEALRRALALRPGYAEAHHNLGVLLRETGDLAAAEAELERALELKPGAAEVRAALERTRELRRGSAAGQQPPPDGEPENEPGTGPGSEPAAERLAAALELARGGRLEEAERRLAALADEHPGDAETLYNLGLVRSRLGRREAAAEAYQAALAADPEHAPALNNLGILAAAAGDPAAARELLERAVAADLGDAEAHFNLGVVYDQTGDSRRAVEAIERAVELDPGNRRFHQALGLLYQALGEPERARPHLEAAGQ